MTPALRRWEKRLREGYTIQREWVLQGAFPNWHWVLVNPQGVTVATVRRDTVRRLSELGVLDDHDEGSSEDEIGAGSVAGSATG